MSRGHKRKTILRLALIMSLVSVLCSPLVAQCVLIDPGRDSVFISYERLGEASGAKKDRDAVILRLRNNTDCAIYITAASAQKFLKPLPEKPTVADRIKREIDHVLPDGVLVPDIEYYFPTRHGPQKSLGGDMFYAFKILGQRSILFEVPFEHIDGAANGKLTVPFRYANERESRGEHFFPSVENTVSFRFGGLPEEVLKSIRRR